LPAARVESRDLGRESPGDQRRPLTCQLTA